MSDGVHMLIPFAYSSSEGCAEALRGLALPCLEKLVGRLSKGEADRGDEHALSMPHERVLARAHGLPAPDGLIPWAAWQVAQSGRDPGDTAWAWITPCHWRVATDHILMGHPQQLHLDAQASMALCEAMRPYFEQDGITLQYHAPTSWLARGEIFRTMPTASLDRVAGRTIDDWMPRAAQARTVRRLQQEMQMLLYTHRVNDERTGAGLLPVNSFWVSGTGALPGDLAVPAPAGLQMTHALREAALAEDWPAWASAWRGLDAQEIARLSTALDEAQPVTLTLCGERHAQSWTGSGQNGWTRRMASLFARTHAASLLQQL
jgi:hypothetical protein